MKTNLKWLGLGGILATALLFAMDLPASQSFGPADDLFKACMNSVKPDCESWAREGGEAPRGLTKDTKVELALGERYLLVGTISIQGGDPYLKIDFNHAPWLASHTRTKNPYYRIDDDAANWAKYRGRQVTIIATAKYSTFKTSAGQTVMEIYLQPAPGSVIDALQELSGRYSTRR